MNKERKGYGDRLALEIKDFGRKVVIKVLRSRATVSPDGKTVTIEYPDDENRNKKIPKSK